MHSLLPHSTLVECEGAGHMVIMERHIEVNKALDELIAAADEHWRDPAGGAATRPPSGQRRKSMSSAWARQRAGRSTRRRLSAGWGQRVGSLEHLAVVVL